VLFFLIGVGIGRPIIENLVFAIGIIVANVPEGLLSTVTVALSITAKRMAAKSVLVKNLEAVETLGSTSCICSDKTGTLTMNVMTVAHVYYDFTIKQVNHHNPLQGEFDTRNASMQHLIRVAACCNNCVYEIGVDEKGNEIQDIKGDASEKGITKVSARAPPGRSEDGKGWRCPVAARMSFCDSHILCVCFDCVLSSAMCMLLCSAAASSSTLIWRVVSKTIASNT
jgi:sodium/potassium-transporting ATPase subunit alpha